ncbi:TM2 domain-containing protein [Acidobacteriota bacterium]
MHPRRAKRYCQNCGVETEESKEICLECGVRFSVAPPEDAKSMLAAGLLGIFLGCFGVHRFYLGYNGIGLTQLLLFIFGILTCGVTSLASWIWGLIDGILILTGTIDRDARGEPLKE